MCYPYTATVENKRLRKAYTFIKSLANYANFTRNVSHGALTLFDDGTQLTDDSLKPSEMNPIQFSDQFDLTDYLEALNRTIKKAEEEKCYAGLFHLLR